MNRKLPRVLNRIGLFLIGILLIAFGAATLTISCCPVGKKNYHKILHTLQPEYQKTYQMWAYQGTQNWLALFVALTGIVLLILVLASIWAQFGKRSRRLAVQKTVETEGNTAIKPQFVTGVLKQHLLKDSWITDIKTTGWENKKQEVLLVRVTAAKGASPEYLHNKLRSTLERLDRAMGNKLPVVVHFVSGRAKQNKN